MGASLESGTSVKEGQTSQNEKFRARWKALGTSAPKRRSGGRERGQGYGSALPGPNFCVLELFMEKRVAKSPPI